MPLLKILSPVTVNEQAATLYDERKPMRRDRYDLIPGACRGLSVADHYMTVRGFRIKPVENGLHYRSLTVKSPRRHHKISRYLPVPS